VTLTALTIFFGANPRLADMEAPALDVEPTEAFITLLLLNEGCFGAFTANDCALPFFFLPLAAFFFFLSASSFAFLSLFRL